jgi:hypothetical protein
VWVVDVSPRGATKTFDLEGRVEPKASASKPADRKLGSQTLERRVRHRGKDVPGPGARFTASGVDLSFDLAAIEKGGSRSEWQFQAPVDSKVGVQVQIPPFGKEQVVALRPDWASEDVVSVQVTAVDASVLADYYVEWNGPNVDYALFPKHEGKVSVSPGGGGFSVQVPPLPEGLHGHVTSGKLQLRARVHVTLKYAARATTKGGTTSDATIDAGAAVAIGIR